MQKIILFLMIIIPFFLNAQTKTWDGEGTTDNWSEAANWDLDVLPVATDDVDLNGSTVILDINATVERVNGAGSTNFTINTGVTLTIDGFAGDDDGLELNTSTICINNGTIDISNISGASADGILSKGNFTNNGSIIVNNVGEHGVYVQGGLFTNNAGATITVNIVGVLSATSGGDPDGDGIYADDNGGTASTFENNGTITITMSDGDDGMYINDGSTLNNNAGGLITISGTVSTDNGIRIDDSGTFDNKAMGTLTINATVDDQLFLDNDGMFTNAGTVNLNNSSDVGLYVTDEGVLTNNANGMFNVTNSNNYGVQIDANSSTANIVNNGTFTITGGSNDGIRLQEQGIFNNNASGVLNIVTPGDEGIQIDDGATPISTFNNSGLVDITDAVGHGMEVYGTFKNLPGSTLKIYDSNDDGIRMRNAGIFNNDGAIRIDRSTSEDIETDKVTGVAGTSFTNSATATFAPGASPGHLEIKDDFDMGSSTTTFEINGTTAATDYDQILNSSSGVDLDISGATGTLVWGFTPAIGDCFLIVDGSGDVTGTFATLNLNNPAPGSFDIEVTYPGTEVEICIVALGALPVELVHFTGEKTERGSELNWVTASEVNNEGFAIERSTNGHDWTKIGFAQGKGNSDIIENYSFLDLTPFNGDNYYRLKQVDFDGKFEYSKIIYLQNEKLEIPTTIYPNPAHDILNYEGPAATLTFYDIYGRQVMQQTTNEERANLDISRLEIGVYMIEVSNNTNEKVFKRFIKN